MLAQVSRKSLSFCLSCAVALGTLLSAPNSIRAETTIKRVQRKIHKIQGKLHELGKGAGQVLHSTGEAALVGAGICAVLAGALIDSDGDGNETGDYRTKDRPTAPPNNAPGNGSIPSRPSH
jgi:hypothetical protein